MKILTPLESDLLKAVKFLMANRDKTKDSLSHVMIKNMLIKLEGAQANKISFYILLAECDENITVRDRVTGKEETLFFDSFDEAEKYALNVENLKEAEFFICEEVD